MFLHVVAQMPRYVAMKQGAGRYHFRVQQRVLGEQPMKIATVAIGPIHHGGDGELPALWGNGYLARHGKDYPSRAREICLRNNQMILEKRARVRSVCK